MPKNLTKNRGLTAALIPIKRQGWWKGKFALFWKLETWSVRGWGGWEGSCSKADSCPTQPPTISRQGLLEVKRGGRLHAETAQSALPGLLKLTVGCLISIYLTVKSTVSLQFQDQFVPISLRLVL